MDVQTIIISICFIVFFLVAYYIWKSMYELQFRVDSLEQRLGSRNVQNDSTKACHPKNKSQHVAPEKVTVVQEGGGSGSSSLPTTYSSEMLQTDMEQVFMDAPLSIVQRMIGEEHILNPSELFENVGISLSNVVNEGIKDLMMDNQATFSSFIFTSAPLYNEEPVAEHEERVFEIVNDLSDILETYSDKKEETLIEPSVEEIIPVLSDPIDEYKSKTVAELKAICQTYGLPTSKTSGHKTKRELVETITQFIEQKKTEADGKK